MLITIPGRQTSWNSIYSSRSYWTRKILVDTAHEQIRGVLLEMGIMPNRDKNLYKNKVDIDITAYFKTRCQDSDNIPAKVIVDSLKGYLLIDDNNKYVGRVSTEAIIDDYERVEIVITER